MSAASYSVLFGDSRPRGVDDTQEPDYFGDLRLDQVVGALLEDGDRFHLAPLYHAIVHDPAVLALRQDVFDDVAQDPVHKALEEFSSSMEQVHSWIRASKSLRAPAQCDRWHLNAAAAYCATVRDLEAGLAHDAVRSEALRTIARLVRDHAASAAFGELEREASSLEARLNALQYAVHLHGARITVGAYDGEPDYGRQVVELFSRFRQDQHAARKEEAEERRRHRVAEAGGDPVRERVVGLVAQLHPGLFEELAAFRRRHADLLDPTVSLFYREVQFYLRYRDLVDRLEEVGLPVTRPVLRSSPGLDAEDTYDVALALHRGDSASALVRNGVRLEPDERRLVVTGPNQGGKTTFSRTIGQLHHLAALGCPVPGTRVELQPPDRILTHFERQELGHTTGKLEDDLLRLHTILEHATSRSLVVLNEIFASTTTADAVELGRAVLDRLGASGALYVCVTFLDELAHLPGTVTMVAQVDPADPSRRTFRVVRAAADGRAYATALAVKHGLTYDAVKARIEARIEERAR